MKSLFLYIIILSLFFGITTSSFSKAYGKEKKEADISFNINLIIGAINDLYYFGIAEKWSSRVSSDMVSPGIMLDLTWKVNSFFSPGVGLGYYFTDHFEGSMDYRSLFFQSVLSTEWYNRRNPAHNILIYSVFDFYLFKGLYTPMIKVKTGMAIQVFDNYNYIGLSWYLSVSAGILMYENFYISLGYQSLLTVSKEAVEFLPAMIFSFGYQFNF